MTVPSRLLAVLGEVGQAIGNDCIISNSAGSGSLLESPRTCLPPTLHGSSVRGQQHHRFCLLLFAPTCQETRCLSRVSTSLSVDPHNPQIDPPRIHRSRLLPCWRNWSERARVFSILPLAQALQIPATSDHARRHLWCGEPCPCRDQPIFPGDIFNIAHPRILLRRR